VEVPITIFQFYLVAPYLCIFHGMFVRRPQSLPLTFIGTLSVWCAAVLIRFFFRNYLGEPILFLGIPGFRFIVGVVFSLGF